MSRLAVTDAIVVSGVRGPGEMTAGKRASGVVVTGSSRTGPDSG